MHQCDGAQMLQTAMAGGWFLFKCPGTGRFTSCHLGKGPTALRTQSSRRWLHLLVSERGTALACTGQVRSQVQAGETLLEGCGLNNFNSSLMARNQNQPALMWSRKCRLVAFSNSLLGFSASSSWFCCRLVELSQHGFGLCLPHLSTSDSRDTPRSRLFFLPFFASFLFCFSFLFIFFLSWPSFYSWIWTFLSTFLLFSSVITSVSSLFPSVFFNSFSKVS